MTALKDIQAIRVNNGSGVVEYGTVRVRDASGLKVVWADAGPLTVVVDNLSPTGARASDVDVTVPTAIVTLTIAGGVGPYSVTWSRVDSGSPAWAITSPDGPATRFNTAVAAGNTETAEFHAVVTDAAAATVTSDTVYAAASNFGGY